MANEIPGRILLRDVRLAFPNIFKAESVSGGDPRYSALFILPPDHPQLARVQATLKAVAKAKWGDKAAAIYGALEKQDKLALHDGDTKSQYDGFEGNMYVSSAAKADARPLALDSNKRPLTEADGRLYSGCYVVASLEFWAQDSAQFGKRINAQLRGVQFLRDGAAFGGGRPADDDEFADESGGTDAGFDEDDAPF